MSYLANGRRRPGPRPSLTREDIVRAALDTRPSPGGDTPGRHTPGGDTDLSTLTMPALAARLGVSHSTLYRYVASRDDLMIAVVDHAMRCWTWPAAEGPWRRLLERFSDSLWAFVHHFPGIARVIWEMVVIPPAMLELARSYIEALHRDGLSRADCLLAYDFVADITIAQSIAMDGLDVVVDTDSGPRTRRELHQRALAPLADQHPELTSDETWTGQGWLNQKIAVFLDGLEQRAKKAHHPG